MLSESQRKRLRDKTNGGPFRLDHCQVKDCGATGKMIYGQGKSGQILYWLCPPCNEELLAKSVKRLCSKCHEGCHCFCECHDKEELEEDL